MRHLVYLNFCACVSRIYRVRKFTFRCLSLFLFSTDADLGFPRSQVKRTFSVNPFPVWHVPANILEVETKNIAERQEKTTKNYSWLVEFDC